MGNRKQASCSWLVRGPSLFLCSFLCLCLLGSFLKFCPRPSPIYFYYFSGVILQHCTPDHASPSPKPPLMPPIFLEKKLSAPFCGPHWPCALALGPHLPWALPRVTPSFAFLLTVVHPLPWWLGTVFSLGLMNSISSQVKGGGLGVRNT